MSVWMPGFEGKADEVTREEGQRGTENSLRCESSVFGSQECAPTFPCKGCCKLRSSLCM